MIRPNFWPFVKEFSLSHNFSTPPTTSGGGGRWVMVMVSKSDVTKFFAILDQSKKNIFPINFFWDITYLLREGRGSTGVMVSKKEPDQFYRHFRQF